MVHHAQNYWVFGLFPSSGILGTRKHDVSETGSVPVLRCLPPAPEYGNMQFPKRRVFSSSYNTGRWKKSKNPVILSINNKNVVK
jgi:hypothetical protein